jgi:hypothetical protein
MTGWRYPYREIGLKLPANAAGNELRMSRLLRLVALASTFAGASAIPAGAEPLATVLSTPPAPAALTPNLVAAATSAQAPLTIAPLVEPGRARLGDEVTACVQLRDAGRTRFWLVHLRIAEPTPKEIAAHPPMTRTMTATTGRVYSFATGGGLAVDIQTLGPVEAGSSRPAAVKRARAFVSPDLLAIGLDQSCRAMLRLLADHKADAPGAQKLSESDERAVLGFFPALMTFFQTVEKSPGLRDILWDLIEKPSVWSVVKHRGVDLGLQLGDNSIAIAALPAWSGPALPHYRMSFELRLNDVPALECSLFVTQPVPPLLTTAGIIGIVAQPPGKPEKQLEIRLVGSRRGSGGPR